MKRTPLKRDTPKTRAWLRKPRKPLPKVSKSPRKTRRRAKYEDARAIYLADKVTCEICERPDILELHHVKGRVGTLLFDEQFFMALCYTCHIVKIHGNPAWAREKGYLK